MNWSETSNSARRHPGNRIHRAVAANPACRETALFQTAQTLPCLAKLAGTNCWRKRKRNNSTPPTGFSAMSSIPANGGKSADAHDSHDRPAQLRLARLMGFASLQNLRPRGNAHRQCAAVYDRLLNGIAPGTSRSAAGIRRCGAEWETCSRRIVAPGTAFACSRNSPKSGLCHGRREQGFPIPPPHRRIPAADRLVPGAIRLQQPS